MKKLAPGLYERLLDSELQALLQAQPELVAVLRSIDDEDAPHTYVQFLSVVLTKVLRSLNSKSRVPLVNRILQLLSKSEGQQYLDGKSLPIDSSELLVQLGCSEALSQRPHTPLSTSALLTGQGADPPLEHELRAEMQSVDRVDILVSFIKWSGLRLLIPGFERLQQENVPVRVLSTSYMGASDPHALEWLAKQPNVDIRVSYDTGGTRLHAKAYHFVRNSGYSTAYVGSANMSYSAMTQGLEWTVKATRQDMPHILDRFLAEFAAYWESDEFEPYGREDFTRFREAIARGRDRPLNTAVFFAEIHPRPFQQRVLEALDAERLGGHQRNLVVAATGTGKTVIAALDYQRFCLKKTNSVRPRLLFVAHRKEILQQALSCFRAVVRDQNFGEVLVDGHEPVEWQHVFASVQSLRAKRPWLERDAEHFAYVVIDEAHHGTASSYRSIFDSVRPQFLLGLTATPERMDGTSILPDFGGHFAAEIRLAEALEEKLLCPFHYFGVSDSVDLSDESFWRNGRYDIQALENVFTGDDLRARQRLDVIFTALRRYQPDVEGVRAVGFCVGVDHAYFMAKHFTAAGYAAQAVVGNTSGQDRDTALRDLREGRLQFLFTVDVLSEGVDVPEINLVMFLRPTESLTVFLQQLGRGLRHAPGKDCLTVLDFVGQTHRNYRLDTKFSALLSRRRHRLDKEIENDFPHLPPGCNIQLERVAKERVLSKVRSILKNLQTYVPEVIKTWDEAAAGPLSFGNFMAHTDISPVILLKKRSWSTWKADALNQPLPTDPELDAGRKALARISLRSDPLLLNAIAELPHVSEPEAKYSDATMTSLHYLFWSKKGGVSGLRSLDDSMRQWKRNTSIAQDAAEIASWRLSNQAYPVTAIDLPFACPLHLHGAYGLSEIKSAFRLATLEKAGQTGVGALHIKTTKVYICLVTFRKSEADFSPTTRYRDYPISPRRLHWESQSATSQESPTGQMLINFKEKGYTVLFFARVDKRIDGETAPFVFLGPAQDLLSYEGDRPIAMIWELAHAMPAAIFEEARPA